MSSPETRIGEKERPWELGAALGRVLGLEGEDILVDQTPFCYPKRDGTLSKILERLLTVDELADASLLEFRSIIRTFVEYTSRQAAAARKGRHAFPTPPRLRTGQDESQLVALAARIGATRADFVHFEGMVTSIIHTRREARQRDVRIHQDFQDLIEDEEIRLKYEEMSREGVLEAIIGLLKTLMRAREEKERRVFSVDAEETVPINVLNDRIRSIENEIRVAEEVASTKKEAA